MTVLLAKSRTHGELTLHKHLCDTEDAAMALFGGNTRWAARWPAFFRLSPTDARRFLVELRVAALFHDLGKANADFQRAVTATERFEQTLRHEHLSALVMSLPEVRAWLVGAGLDVDVCVGAVLSHHLKAQDGAGDWTWCQTKAAPRVALFLQDAQVAATLERVRALLGLSDAPQLPTAEVTSAGLDDKSNVWGKALAAGQVASKSFRRALWKDESRQMRLAAVKVALIVCDGLASGLFRTGDDIDAWVTKVAHAEALSASRIADDIITRRLDSIASKTKKAAQLHPFQAQAASVGPRGLLLAACGAGKTLAAWKWAEEQARTHQFGRVIFLYPTRGTATEGFRDYAAWAPEGDAMLLHGTADYELERMHDNPPESLRGRGGHGPSEAEKRLFALGLWGKRYFSATVDQFLAALQCRYDSLCLMPALADAAVIIDEVHSFDAQMFRSLVTFLKLFDVPVLCMTATLPPSRRAELEAAGLRVFPSAEESAALADLAAKECAPRYQLTRVADAEAAEAIALAAFAEGKRVLWVVNQVSRAQSLALALAERTSSEVLCYHSRFRLEDRQRVHAATVAAFQQTTAPVLAVTTQVCEMSLDLDADVLITEECPVTSLVQRFGRANRHLRTPGFLATLVTYAPPKRLPYSPDDLEGVTDFLAAFDGQTLSQAQLAAQLANLATRETASSGHSALLDGGYFAVEGDFRETDDFARPALLSTDVARATELYRARQSIDGLLVPVPKRFCGPTNVALLPAWLGAADAQHYDTNLGFIAPQKELS